MYASLIINITQSHSCTGRLVVDPERDPRQHHYKYRRQVGLEHEVTDVPFELEAERETLVGSGGEFLDAVVCAVTNDGKLRQLRLLYPPHWRGSPVHHHVRHCVAVCNTIYMFVHTFVGLYIWFV